MRQQILMPNDISARLMSKATVTAAHADVLMQAHGMSK